MKNILLFALSAFAKADELNPPNWDTEKVLVFTPGEEGVQQKLDDIYSVMINEQWSDSRYAIFFKPGNHSVNAGVGYYTEVYGLGATPADTILTDVHSIDNNIGSALCNFWRSVSNLQINKNVTYAVS